MELLFRSINTLNRGACKVVYEIAYWTHVLSIVTRLSLCSGSVGSVLAKVSIVFNRDFLDIFTAFATSERVERLLTNKPRGLLKSFLQRGRGPSVNGTADIIIHLQNRERILSRNQTINCIKTRNNYFFNFTK